MRYMFKKKERKYNIYQEIVIKNSSLLNNWKSCNEQTTDMLQQWSQVKQPFKMQFSDMYMRIVPELVDLHLVIICK